MEGSGPENDNSLDLNSFPFGVRVYQVRQDDDGNVDDVCYLKQDDTTEAEDDEQAVIVSCYERFFPIGSTISFPVQATAPRKKGVERNPATFHISSGTKLSIHTVSIDPMTTSFTRKGEIDDHFSIYISTDMNPDYLCICPYLAPFTSKRDPHSTVASLNLEVCGPSVIHLAAHRHTHGESVGSRLSNVNIFGTVSLLESSYGGAVAEARKKSLEQLRLPAITDGGKDIKLVSNSTDKARRTIDKTSIDQNNKNKGKQQHVDKVPSKIPTKTTAGDGNQTRKQTANSPIKQAKRKATVLENDTITSSKASESTAIVEDTNGVKEDTITETYPKPMTKKQRRKLAKQKAKELEEAIAREQGYPTRQEQEQAASITTTTTTKTTGKQSLTRKRFLPGGIVVQDLVHGLGITARTGRKVAIHYRGTLPDTGKVFDKNQSKDKPLVFRVGTGEVIKGLERGIEGMKVGGERVITIPPKFGYGTAGQPDGGIPKNATLCFAITLISVGGS